FDQIATNADQLAQKGEVINLLGQFTWGKKALTVSRQAREVSGPSKLRHRGVGLEIRLQRDRSDDHLLVEKHAHAFENPRVERFEEMFRADRHGQFFEQAVIDQYRAEERCFRLEIRRQSAAGGAISSGGVGGGSVCNQGGHRPLMLLLDCCRKGVQMLRNGRSLWIMGTKPALSDGWKSSVLPRPCRICEERTWPTIASPT